MIQEVCRVARRTHHPVAHDHDHDHAHLCGGGGMIRAQAQEVDLTRAASHLSERRHEDVAAVNRIALHLARAPLHLANSGRRETSHPAAPVRARRLQNAAVAVPQTLYLALHPPSVEVVAALRIQCLVHHLRDVHDSQITRLFLHLCDVEDSRMIRLYLHLRDAGDSRMTHLYPHLRDAEDSRMIRLYLHLRHRRGKGKSGVRMEIRRRRRRGGIVVQFRDRGRLLGGRRMILRYYEVRHLARGFI
jgi:hypothetical protein